MLLSLLHLTLSTTTTTTNNNRYNNRDQSVANLLDPDKTFVFHWSFKIEVQYTKVDYNEDNLRDLRFWRNTMAYPAILGLCLPIFNFFFTRLAYTLNDFENYRTDTHYRTHLILKVFCFRFVNYFASLYYYLFLTSDNEDPQSDIFTKNFRVGE